MESVEELTLLYPLSDPEGIRKCFEKNGVVGITGILSEKELMETYDDINQLIKTTNPDFNLDDPYSYDNLRSNFNAHGVVGKKPLFTIRLMKNRLHPNVRKAYEILYGTEVGPLICQFDRVALMRRTIGPGYEDWSKYRTPYSKPGIHLDVDPTGYFKPKYEREVSKFLNKLDYSDTRDFMHENNAKHLSMGLQLQGVLNLYDNEELDGGFHCSLGGHKLLNKWFEGAKEHLSDASPNGRYIFSPNYDTDKMFSETTRIPCPAGTLILFDAALPHGTKPNYTENNRMIQFLRYMPRAILGSATLNKRRKALDKIFNEMGFIPSEEEEKYL